VNPAALAILTLVMAGTSAMAQKSERKAGVDLTSASTISDTLTALKGRAVTLILSNGVSIEGILSKNSDFGSPHTQLIALDQISGKELSSAMILKSSIVAVEYRR
jgi:hypothetical protein